MEIEIEKLRTTRGFQRCRGMLGAMRSKHREENHEQAEHNIEEKIALKSPRTLKTKGSFSTILYLTILPLSNAHTHRTTRAHDLYSFFYTYINSHLSHASISPTQASDELQVGC